MTRPRRRARRDREQQRAQPLGAAKELLFSFPERRSRRKGRGDSDRELPRLPGRRAAVPLSQGEDDRRQTGALSLVLLLKGPGSKGLGALVDRRGDGAVPAGREEDEVASVLVPEGLCDGVLGPDGSQEAAEEDGVEGACGVRKGKKEDEKGRVFFRADVDVDE